MRNAILILLTGIFILINGCGVSKSDHQKMVSEREAIKENLEELTEVQTEIFLLKEKSSILDNENKALRVQIEKLKLELKQRKKVTKSKPRRKKAVPKIKGRFYTVKKGDSLWRISQQTGVSVADLRKLNNIIGTQIRIGQKLLLTP